MTRGVSTRVSERVTVRLEGLGLTIRLTHRLGACIV